MFLYDLYERTVYEWCGIFELVTLAQDNGMFDKLVCKLWWEYIRMYNAMVDKYNHDQYN